MAEERDDEQFNQTEGKTNQQPDQSRQQNEFGQQPGQPGELQPPETMSGGGNLGGQSSSGATDADTLQDDRAQTNGGSSGSTGERFIGSQGGDASTEDDSDIETGQASRLQDSDTDIESGSGAA